MKATCMYINQYNKHIKETRSQTCGYRATMSFSPVRYYTRPKPLKAYIKFLAACHDPVSQRCLIERAPDTVIKSISDAALNVAAGDVALSRSQKAQLRRYKRLIQMLIKRNVAISRKRQALKQRGGFAILPILLSAVLSALGSQLFNK